MQSIYYDSVENVMYFASPKKFISYDGMQFEVFSEKEGYKINGLSGQIVSFVKADSPPSVCRKTRPDNPQRRILPESDRVFQMPESRRSNNEKQSQSDGYLPGD
jgi:hypothetical protein